jgi:hypothetical protein
MILYVTLHEKEIRIIKVLLSEPECRRSVQISQIETFSFFIFPNLALKSYALALKYNAFPTVYVLLMMVTTKNVYFSSILSQRSNHSQPAFLLFRLFLSCCDFSVVNLVDKFNVFHVRALYYTKNINHPQMHKELFISCNTLLHISTLLC